jgi:F0F1-type ATP synthase delta subunit
LDKVRVYTARKLNNSELENLRQALVKITKKDIEIIKVVDRSLIGGIKIEGDAYTIDDTIKYKIENFYKENFNVKIK